MWCSQILAIFSTIFIGLRCVDGMGCPVGSDIVPDMNACLAFDDDGLPFDVAEIVCGRSSGHLTSIHNAFENSLIGGLTKNHSISPYLMIGLKRNGSEWRWTDGTQNGYYNWAAGEPGTGDCGAMYTDDNKWKSIDCAGVTPYACKIPLAGSSPTPTMTTPPTRIASSTSSTNSLSSTTEPRSMPTQPDQHGACQDRWIYLKATNMCYWHGKKKSFESAESFCVSNGGHLASVHSEEENDFIQQLTWVNYCADFNGFNYGSTFLGGSLDTEHKALKWLDGSPDDFRGNICESSDALSLIMLHSFPTTCSSHCRAGDWWPMNPSSSNTTISDFVCKSPPRASSTTKASRKNY